MVINIGKRFSNTVSSWHLEVCYYVVYFITLIGIKLALNLFLKIKKSCTLGMTSFIVAYSGFSASESTYI